MFSTLGVRRFYCGAALAQYTQHLKPWKRHFTTRTGIINAWMRDSSEAYKPGSMLRISIPNSPRTTRVKIVRAMTPFTISVVLVVDTLGALPGLPSQLILKLADRRFGDTRRIDLAWSPLREVGLQTELPPQLRKYGGCPSYPLHGISYNEDPYWFCEMFYWKFAQRYHNAERQAYEHLTEAQSLGLIPRFFGETRVKMSPSGDDDHPVFSHIDGLLLEYIPGRSMASIDPGVDIPSIKAEAISQKVLALGRQLRRYGVTHGDIHLGNVILRFPNDDPVLIDWGRADFSDAHLPLVQRWSSYGPSDDFSYCLRRILKMEHDDSGNVWHRVQTPLTDLEQRQQIAPNIGWELTNREISELPVDVLQDLCEEDLSIDPKVGLRWRLKEGKKARQADDPVPSP